MPLAAKVLQFLYEPIRYLNPVRLRQWIPEAEVQGAIMQTRRGWDALNDYLLTQLNLDREIVLPPLLPRQQLLYASANTIRRLAKFAGVAICADEVRHTILKKEREELLRGIGDEIYSFALRKAIFFRPKNIRLDLLPGTGKSLPTRVIITGKFCVAACLCDLPEALLMRFQLKFRPGENWAFPQFRKRFTDRIWTFLQNLLTRYCPDSTQGGDHVDA
ncbi:MAG: Yop proteins translocation protein K [Puniceicoccales bacterium]|nr:Yop proteins translocation protein K [Puniceicoccales bacterium]